jgi:sugar phosphate isomerase/epimerase
MKLGAITNGISQDLEEALQIMVKDGIEYAELQFIWGKEICHHTEDENNEIKNLLNMYRIKPACIMKHVLNGLSVMDTEIESASYQEQIRLLKKSIELARFLGTNITRIQPFAKQNVVFGKGGAEKYLSGNNESWIKFLKLLEPCCQIAEENEIYMMIETGTGSFIHTVNLAKKAIDELQCKWLKILWDPANCLYSEENPLSAYEMAADDIIDVHIKDIRINKPLAAITYCPLGYGAMAQFTEEIAEVLKKSGYNGVVTFENQVIPPGKTEMEGWEMSVGMFKEIFG